MTSKTNNSERLSECRKLFNKKKRLAQKVQQIESDWQQSFQAIWKTEDSETGDLPDTIVDVVDYGTDDMSFKEFVVRMDMEFERQKGDSVNG